MPNLRVVRLGFLGLAFWLQCIVGSLPLGADAQSPLSHRVLVVFNSRVPDSRAVAKYYAQHRSIPASNLCPIAPPSPIALSWKDYVSSVKAPVQRCLNSVGRQNVLYIVFTYQTPYRVAAPSAKLTYALDQYVADIWDQYTQHDFQPRPTVFQLQPYYDDARSKENLYKPFVSFADFRAQPSALLIYSVWRLDAATAELAKGMVDKAIAAESNGLIGQACFDLRGPVSIYPDSGYGAGDWDLFRAASFARDAGFTVVEDNTKVEFGTPPAPDCPNAAIYAGWYSLGRYNDAFTWSTGAIGFHLDSASAVNPRDGPNWSANAIKRGITITTGAIAEPYLDGLVRPGGTFRDLFQGANVGDTFLRNTRYLKWMILYLGDPLYRPFPQGRPPFNSHSAATPRR